MDEKLKVVKVINTEKKYVDNNGKERVSCNYYLVVNGNYVAIRPSFAKGYISLDTIAEVIKNGKSKLNDK